jgi:hypothetical protein
MIFRFNTFSVEGDPDHYDDMFWMRPSGSVVRFACPEKLTRWTFCDMLMRHSIDTTDPITEQRFNAFVFGLPYNQVLGGYIHFPWNDIKEKRLMYAYINKEWCYLTTECGIAKFVSRPYNGKATLFVAAVKEEGDVKFVVVDVENLSDLKFVIG